MGVQWIICQFFEAERIDDGIIIIMLKFDVFIGKITNYIFFILLDYRI